MPFRLLHIVLLVTAFSHLDAAILKGVVHENVQSGEPVANVQITAIGANLTTSDSFGNFTLDFKGKDPGETVSITVKKSGYTVVNRESLILNLPAPARVDNAVIAIVLCQEADYDQRRRQYDVFIAGGVDYVASKSKEQVTPNGDPSKTDFEPYIKEWASQYGLSVEQAQAEVEKWAAEVQQKRDSVSDLALAEFVNKHFEKAKELFKQSAQQTEVELENSERQEEELREHIAKLRAKLVNDLRRAGDSSYDDYHFAEALESYQEALGKVKRNSEPQIWAATIGDIGRAHNELGIRVEGKAGNEHLAGAVAAYRSALEIYTRAELPQDWAMTQNYLGDALRDQAARTEGAKGAELLAQAVGACRSALEVYTREQSPPNWAMTQNSLGNALLVQAARTEGAKGAELLAQAVNAYQSALEVYTREQSPRNWATTQSNLGNALSELAARTEGPKRAELLAQAVSAFRSALEVRTREQSPQDWAAAENNLGIALREQGKRTGGAQGTEFLAQAVAAYRSALEVRTREQLPQQWAQTQNNLGNALFEQAIRAKDAQGTELLAQAVAAYRSALEVRTREQLPQDWAQTQSNLGNALEEQGKRTGGAQDTELLAQAVAAYRSALEVYTHDQLPQDWALTQNQLGNTLAEQGKRTGGAQGTELLAQAVAAYRSALEVRTREQLPRDWAQTQSNLGNALETVGSQLKGDEGLKRLQESVKLLRDVISHRPDDLSRRRLVSALGNLAFDLILDRQFAEAQIQSEEAQRLVSQLGAAIQKTEPYELIFIQQNLAHALLFQGHYDEALAIYRENWDKPQNGKTFGEVTLENFAEFDKAGLTHPDLSRMKRALAKLNSGASGP